MRCLNFHQNKYDITKLLDCDTINNRGWGNYLPFLVFEHIITTHHFNPTQYYRKYQHRKIIRDKVWELHNKGWGYTKIHRHLIENGFEIGKSRTTVDSIIKKIKKWEEFLSQTIIDGIENIFIRFFKYYFKS